MPDGADDPGAGRDAQPLKHALILGSCGGELIGTDAIHQVGDPRGGHAPLVGGDLRETGARNVDAGAPGEAPPPGPGSAQLAAMGLIRVEAVFVMEVPGEPERSCGEDGVEASPVVGTQQVGGILLQPGLEGPARPE